MLLGIEMFGLAFELMLKANEKAEQMREIERTLSLCIIVINNWFFCATFEGRFTF